MGFTVKTRMDMEYYFDSILQNNYDDIKTKRQYSYGNSAVKSYIIENHEIGPTTSHDAIASFLHGRARAVQSEAFIRDTQEESLVELESEDVNFLVDLSDRRYLVFHTAEPTKVADPFIRKFQGATGLDSLWLPVPLLLSVQNFGRLWGMGVSFRQALDQSDEHLEPEDGAEDGAEGVLDISLSVQRHFAQKFTQILLDSELRHLMGISKLAVWNGSRLTDDGVNDQKFIIDDVKYNGKITAKGTSFGRHAAVIHALREMYKSTVEKIESYRLTFGERGLEGAPVTIRFSHHVSPAQLVELMFNADEPFRLWGVEDRIGEDAYRVYAVDLHHGNKGNNMTVEISPEWIRVALPGSACGNTILRLYANLNHYVDAMAKLEVANYALAPDALRV